MASDKTATPNEAAAIDLLITYAFDLLSHAEAQQRSIRRAQLNLTMYVQDCRHAATVASRRKACVEGVAETIKEVADALRGERDLLFEMRRVLMALQRSGAG
jgi:hypothetical protein